MGNAVSIRDRKLSMMNIIEKLSIQITYLMHANTIYSTNFYISTLIFLHDLQPILTLLYNISIILCLIGFFAFVYNHNYTAEMFQMMFNYFVKNVSVQGVSF